MPFAVRVLEGSADTLCINRREALRYLGYGRNSADGQTEKLLDSCERELRQAIKPMCCYAIMPLSFPAKFAVDIGFGVVESVALYKHLQGCHSAMLFAATIGAGFERLSAKYARLSPSKNAVLDALGSAAIEAWCDRAEAELTKDEPLHCDRYSPGYGDFPLEHQRDFMRALDMYRLIGVSLSDSLLMTPAKSVTAVIGLGAVSLTCGHKCMSCEKESCIYREVAL